MTTTSFFIPTDKDILRDLKENAQTVKFTGEVRVNQGLFVTKFFRTFIFRFDDKKEERQAVYVKNGLKWQFEITKVVAPVNAQKSIILN